ncbi:MAG TPA: 1-deoxy-D-xylulose-5-phosphate synthase, partial [bacterium]|nr:1-deoxy-D-xylulose-5-phosphate synthase [bacterium]
MAGLLDRIDNPTDLKRLSCAELATLADDIRAFLVEKVAVTGGHLASNLGAVELTIALHFVFDLLVDRVVWDVGHQSYVHKILTGRKHRFDSLRQLGGMSGFPKRGESPYDAYETGHSSTSVSVATGIAHAKKLRGEPGKAIAVIGDGSMSSGLVFEALNNAGQFKDNLMVILNDNEMSIAPNVGALSEYLNRLLAAPVYNKFRDDVEELIKRIPNVGQKGYQLTRRIEASLKHMIVPKTIFEEFGFRYLNPIDEHRLEPLIEILRQCRKLTGPLLLHVITTKGCGYRPAEQHPTRFHGIGPFDPDSGEAIKCAGVPSYTQVFGEAMIRLAKDDPRVVAITAAMPDGTGLVQFARELPERFVDVGIAESHAVTCAGGMAATGMRPVVAIYSTFLQRAYDNIMHDVCLPNLPVVLALDRGGIVGEDGETHQGVFDFAYLRHLPNMTVMAPADEAELVQMLATALTLPGP